MDEKITHKKVFKRTRNNDEYQAKRRPKILYNRKFTTPMRKKRKNEYDANEETR